MFQFHWYGLMIGIGVLVSIQASVWLSKRRGVNEEILWSGAWWALAGGLIGARLYHVLDLWTEVYFLDPISILYIWNGGLGIIGGFIGGVIGMFLYFKFQISNFKFNISIKQFLDIAFFGLPLGQAIGRIGNFINQEVYGLPTDLPWGIYIDNKPGRFHPLFAYESIWMLLGFSIMLFSERWESTILSFRNPARRDIRNLFKYLYRFRLASLRSGLKAGMTRRIKNNYFAFYLVWYGIGRFWLDFLRPAEFVWQLNLPSGIELNMAQLSSILMIALGLGLFNSYCAEERICPAEQDPASRETYPF